MLSTTYFYNFLGACSNKGIMSRRQHFLGIIIAILAAIYAALPTLMAALLKHMFTAPNQVPWTGGGHLRLIDIDGMPAQALYSAERARELSSLASSNNFQHKEGDVWVTSYVKSGTRRSVVLAYPECCIYSNIGAMKKVSTVLKSSH